jgi:DNA-binding CsgD family transcriptional regulator
LSSSSAGSTGHPSGSAPDAAELARVLAELQQLERELIEQRYVRRADGLERAGEAVRRLGEIGSPAGVIARAAEELGRSSSFEHVVVSRIEGGRLRPVAMWPDGPLPGPMELGYPLVEDEVAQRHEAVLVAVADSGRRALPALVESFGWEAYVVAAIALEGKIVGLLHADRSGSPPLDDLDVELAALYADGLGLAFERAVLRDKLQRQRRQLGSAARWINGQSLRLAGNGDAPRGADGPAGDGAPLAEVLTPRELEVLRLIARGLSNRAIASALVIGEGTVKYHVKNVLRKLQARSRTEAVSRYMRLYGGSEAR